MDIKYYNKLINRYGKNLFTNDAIKQMDKQVMIELNDIVNHANLIEKNKLLSSDVLSHIIYIKDGYTVI